MTKSSKKQKMIAKLPCLKRIIGNFFRQLLVCLFAIGICAGSILAGLGLGCIFFNDKTGSTLFSISPLLIIPYIIAEILFIPATFALYSAVKDFTVVKAEVFVVLLAFTIYSGLTWRTKKRMNP
jgi:hypothetical protein